VNNQKIDVLFLTGARAIFLVHNIMANPLASHPPIQVSLSVSPGAVSPGLKLPGHDAYPSLLHSAMVKFSVLYMFSWYGA
jgi:hypothetical protein